MITPGERISLITESGRLLEARDWPEIDLILGQFNMRTQDEGNWDGKYNYVIDML